MVLVQSFVDVGDLALAKGVAESVVNIRGSHTKTSCGVAVNHNVTGKTAHLLVGIDVAQLGDFGNALLDDGGPVREVGQVIGLKRVLVLGAAETAADGEVLDSLQ